MTSRTLLSPRSQTYSGAFGSIASYMRGAIDGPRRRAKRNNVSLPTPKMLSLLVEVTVPRCCRGAEGATVRLLHHYSRNSRSPVSTS
jgi:hypothetical protein